MFVQMGAVEITEPGFVFGEMSRNPIDDHSDLTLMKAIHQVHEIRGRAKSASWCVIANDLIPPGAIEWVLHDREKLDMRITRIMHIVCELYSHFPVSQRTVSLLWHPPPGAEMDFINRDGATQAVSSCAVRHPLASFFLRGSPSTRYLPTNMC